MTEETTANGTTTVTTVDTMGHPIEQIKYEKPPLNLYRKLLEASRLIDDIPKDRENKHLGFWYSSHDAITRACKTAMDAVGLIWLPLDLKYRALQDKKIECTILYQLICVDSGESVSIEWIGWGQDTQDKALYKAETQAKKTFLLHLFKIPSGEVDADGDSGEGYEEPRNQGRQNGNQRNDRNERKNDRQDRRPRNEQQNEPRTEQKPQGPLMFREVDPGRQQKARDAIADLSGKIWGEEARASLLSFAEDKLLLAVDPRTKRPSLEASTERQVGELINALKEEAANQSMETDKPSLPPPGNNDAPPPTDNDDPGPPPPEVHNKRTLIAAARKVDMKLGTILADARVTFSPEVLFIHAGAQWAFDHLSSVQDTLKSLVPHLELEITADSLDQEQNKEAS